MPASYVQVPPDATGKKLRTRERTIGAHTVQEQFLAPGALPTYYAWSGSQTCAGGKFFMAIVNNGAGQVIRVRRLYLQNAQLAAIVSGTSPATVGMVSFEVKKCTGTVGGTVVALNPADSTDAALTNVACVTNTNSVVGEGTVLFNWYGNNDELGLTGAFSQGVFQALKSVLVDGWELKEYELQQGEGICIKQVTNYTLGAFGVLAVITKEL